MPMHLVLCLNFQFSVHLRVPEMKTFKNHWLNESTLYHYRSCVNGKLFVSATVDQGMNVPSKNLGDQWPYTNDLMVTAKTPQNIHLQYDHSPDRRVHRFSVQLQEQKVSENDSPFSSYWQLNIAALTSHADKIRGVIPTLEKIIAIIWPCESFGTLELDWQWMF